MLQRLDEWSRPRENKPRKTGLTVVMDKGLGPDQTADWLAVAAEYVDYVKLGFGTSMLYPRELLQRKIHLIVKAGVAALPGGTLLEAAVVAGDVDGFFAFCRGAGFTHVEVSDGTIPLPPARRRRLVRQAREAGFRVLTEVGKKDPSRPLDPDHALEQIQLDLEAGAEKVIVEGRDSGRGSGVFDGEGGLRDDLFEQLVSGLAPSVADVIWETPRPEQQLELLLRLGPRASFGNVRPEDVFTLEAMRRGLRSDTLRLRMEP